MDFDIKEHFETVVIKDKIWFVCKYGDCDECEVTEEDIISHINHHLNSQKSVSNGGVDTSQTFAQFSNDSIPDIKPKIEIIPVPIDLSRGDPQEDVEPYYCPPKSFKCHIPGCRKTFLYMKSLMLHRNDHKMKAKPLKNVVNPQNNPSMSGAMSPQPIPLPKVVPKSNCNQSAKFNALTIKEKYMRVQRLNDRSIHRWQKQDHRSDANYKGMQSLKNLNQYYRKDIIENEKYYLCQYNTSCTFKTKRSQHMARHLNCCHFRTRIFRCNVRGCDRKYYNPTSLRQHTLNHKCGFGILNGKTMTTICGNKSINRFRKRIIEGEPPLKIYKCDFLDCPFKTKSHTCIKRHIHDQVCHPFL